MAVCRNLNCKVCRLGAGESGVQHGGGNFFTVRRNADGRLDGFISRNAFGEPFVLLEPTELSSQTKLALRVQNIEPPDSSNPPKDPVPEGARLFDKIVEEPAKPPYTREKLFDLVAQLRKFPFPSRSTNIPAAYTYLAQFVAHDISKLRDEGHVLGPFSWSSSALDLASVLDPRNDGEKFDTERHIIVCGTAVGWTHHAETGKRTEPGDLPRDETGEALIPDQRNDSNLLVAQIHLAIIKLYQLIAVTDPGGTPHSWRTETMRHIQSIVLQDLLPRLTGHDWPFDKPFERRSVWTRKKEPFLVPIEFAAACFRIGHSMVRRAGYNLNDDHTQASAADLLLFARKPLTHDWQARWQNLIRLDDDGPNPINAADLVDGFMASKLGESLTFADFSAEPSSHELQNYLHGLQPPFSIHAVSLLRGYSSALPSAQECVGEVLGNEGWVDLKSPYSWMLRNVDPSGDMLESTPLWFYVLSEASSTSGKVVGPLADRIIGETLHAAVAASDGGIVRPDGRIDFVPLKFLRPASPEKFTLPDLLRAARDLWQEHVFSTNVHNKKGH